MATGITIVKDPESEVFYGMDWSAWLGAATIAVSDWSVSGPDTALTFDNDSLVTGSRSTQLRLVGGTVGTVYTVTNRITTAETIPQTDDRSFFVRVHER